MYKKLLIFIPHINVGGVEKNFFIITNYLAKKLNNNLSVITVNKEFTKKLNKKIKIISPKSNKWKNSSMYIKYTISLFLLIKTLISNRNCLIFSFQANWYAIIITKLFGLKIVTRSNTAPEGWSKGVIKNFFYKLVINFSDEIIVNSNEFKKSLKKYFNVNSICIYNPLDKPSMLRLSKKGERFNFFTKKKYLRIVNIGRFTNQKNQMLILKAIKYLNNCIPIKLLIIGRGENYKSLAYIDNVIDFVKKSLELDEGNYCFNFIDKPESNMNKIMSVIYDALGKKKPKIYIPFFIAYSLAKILDILSFVSNKKFAISSIRIKKFCSDTSFETSVSKIGFKSKYSIEDAIKETVHYEFNNPKKDDIVFFTE